ncbi:hypothetical protein BDZ94DRAFT_1121911, partial [Collybia nuda]
EMGSPMISMYLLNNPDHYTSHKYTPIYWPAFVNEAKNAWLVDDTAKTTIYPNNVTLIKKHGRVIGLSPVYDYIYRNSALKNMSLYEWASRCERIK